MNLSENFTVVDLERSAIASSKGIDNRAPEEVIDRAKGVAEHVLEPLAKKFGAENIIINSWYRSEMLERHLCNAAYEAWCKKVGLPRDASAWNTYFARKQHPKGDAVDLEIKGIGNQELFDYIKANLDFDQLILEFYKTGMPTSGWVHVSWVPAHNRKEAFRIG